METFFLDRAADISGVSGTGRVADGVVFDDGTVVLHWRGKWPTTEVLKSVADLHQIHGHDGATRVVYNRV